MIEILGIFVRSLMWVGLLRFLSQTSFFFRAVNGENDQFVKETKSAHGRDKADGLGLSSCKLEGESSTRTSPNVSCVGTLSAFPVASLYKG